MNPFRLRAACAAFVLFAASPARADDLAQYNAAVEAAAVHNRTALAHLRERSLPRAVLALLRLRESFDLFVARYGNEPPAGRHDQAAYATFLVDVPLRIVTAQMMIDFGRPDIAADALIAVCRSLEAMREPPRATAAAEEPACPSDGSR